MTGPTEFHLPKDSLHGDLRVCRLDSSDVHLWSVTLDHFASHRHEFIRMMSFDELIAAQKVSTEHEKNRFIASRGLLRYILSRYTGVEPRRLPVEYQGDASSHLTDAAGNELRFDLSRGAAAALYAISLNRPVGVGIAGVAKPEAALTTWMPKLDETERGFVLSAELSRRALTLFQIVTRHEALTRAQSGRLSMSAVAGGSADATSAMWRHVRTGRWNAGGWAVEDVVFLKGYASAVAARDEDWRLRTIQVKPA